MCVDSVRLHNAESFSVVLLTPSNLTTFVADIHPAYEYLSYVHRADYLRCEVLHQRGGIYLDTDTLCFSNLRFWQDLIGIYDIVNYDGARWREVFGTSVFGPTRPNSNLTREWSSRLRQRLDARYDALRRAREADPNPKNDCLSWTEILRDIVVPVAKDLQRRNSLSYYAIPSDYFQIADDLYSTESILATGEALQASPDAHIMVLNNTYYPDELKRMTRDDILASDIAICGLIRQALGVRRRTESSGRSLTDSHALQAGQPVAAGLDRPLRLRDLGADDRVPVPDVRQAQRDHHPERPLHGADGDVARVGERPDDGGD
jgi:hypothetical protein